MLGIQLPLSIRETKSSNTQERKILIPSTPHKSHRLYTHTPSNPANPRPTLSHLAKVNLLFRAVKQTFLYILLGMGGKMWE